MRRKYSECRLCGEETRTRCRDCSAKFCTSCAGVEPGSIVCPVCTVGADLVADVAGDVALPDLAELVEYAAELVERDRAASTLRKYEAAWDAFRHWCTVYRLQPLPADPRVVVTYLATLERRRLAASTLGLHLAAIGWYHLQAGHTAPSSSPLIIRARDAWRRSLGVEARAPRRALTVDELGELVAATGEDMKGHRDRAALLLGFVGGFRKSELVALTVDDVADVGPDLVCHLRWSKPDQEGKGRYVGIPLAVRRELCAVRAVRAWRRVADVTTGPLLRSVDRHGNVSPGPLSERTIGRIVKQAATPGALAAGVAAGLDDDELVDFVKAHISRLGAHSLRRGFVTAARLAGQPLDVIAKHVGHKRMESTRGYVEAIDALGPDNPARFVFG